MLEESASRVYNILYNILKVKKLMQLCSAGELNIKKTLECGQCFRWRMNEDGSFTGVALTKVARIWEENGIVFIDADERDLPMWRDYFDLETDYEKAGGNFSCCDYMDKCIDFGRGIRILRQDNWEALCSFIISQCNNIPRIMRIVETLCGEFGNPIEYNGEVFYSFPSAQKIAELDTKALAPLRAGYRAEYIINAAKAVSSGELSFDSLRALDTADARKKVMSLHGVGEKVANCFILFGLHRMDAFPIDVWMKRALKENFPKDFDPAIFGEYAGLAQQYIFYYARSGGNE